MSLDIVTPRNVYLSAYYKRSFAFYSIKNREPVILTQLIDTLVRNKHQIVNSLGPVSSQELKDIIGDISKLKYEIQTNKHIYEIRDSLSDTQLYNDYIKKISAQEGQSTHYHTIWLLAECYMYRRLREAFVTRPSFKNFDYFFSHKEEAYQTSLSLIQDLGQYVLTLITDNDTDTKSLIQKQFTSLVKVNLWGNKCDLSLSLGQVSQHDTFDEGSLDKFILVNNSMDVFKFLFSNLGLNNIIIDIVLDNSGYEVFTDLCLASYLLTKNLASSVRFHVKSFPWFISDVTKKDFQWILTQLSKHEHDSLKELGNKWSAEVASTRWSVHEHDFWTLPHDFTYMSSVAPDLYKLLSTSSLIIFKGDLNYRKLMGEKNWDPTTPFECALQNFAPSKILALRTVKAHVVSGLEDGVAEELHKDDPNWMETGSYGLIQFSNKVVPLE